MHGLFHVIWWDINGHSNFIRRPCYTVTLGLNKQSLSCYQVTWNQYQSHLMGLRITEAFKSSVLSCLLPPYILHITFLYVYKALSFSNILSILIANIVFFFVVLVKIYFLEKMQNSLIRYTVFVIYHMGILLISCRCNWKLENFPIGLNILCSLSVCCRSQCIFVLVLASLLNLRFFFLLRVEGILLLLKAQFRLRLLFSLRDKCLVKTIYMCDLVFHSSPKYLKINFSI